MNPLKTPPPAACAECVTTTKPAVPTAPAPQQALTKMFRSSDGKMRVDSGNMSLITDPAAGKTIALNHLTKEAHITPIPNFPAAAAIGGIPAGLPGAVPLNASRPMPNVQDLGKSVIDGHEVAGKRYTFPSVPSLQPPGVPQAPKVAAGVPGMAAAAMSGKLSGVAPAALGMAAGKVPGTPGMPGAPGIPKPPQVTSTEVWTSTKLHLPVLTKTMGSFGEQTCKCKPSAVEPPPSLFQIPAGYKTIEVPAAPSLPKVPKLPG